MNPRGFGFVSHPSQDDCFVPATELEGFLDGDVVSYQERSTAASNLELVERSRTHVMCDAISPDTLRVDPLAGNLTLEAPRRVTPGVAYLVRLEPLTIQSEFSDPLHPDAVAARVFARHDIPETLPQAALREKLRPSRIQRRDLRDLTTITIDDDSSEDLDDALSCEPAAKGDLRVWVHIADVASVVTPGSAIDRAAAAIPTSVYLPDRVRHMLPRNLAADELSLVPQQDRPALTVEMLITQQGECRAVDIFPSLIRSDTRLSYTTAAAVINGDRSNVARRVAELVQQLHQAAARLSIHRAGRGGVDAWRVDAAESKDAKDDIAHELIERLMVQTNESVAHFLHNRALPAVFRAHPALSPELVQELQERLPEAHISHPLDPRSFAALAATYRNTSQEAMFWDAALSVMPRARYQLDPLGHFGLGSDLYAHFTSPLRRYADLLTHRVLHAWFEGARHVDDATMRSAADVINDVARRADAIERDARRIQALAQLQPDTTLDAVVTGSQRRDARVRLLDSNITAVLPRAAHLDPGTRCRVVVTNVEPLQQRLEIRLERSHGTPSSNTTQGSRSKPAPKERSTGARKSTQAAPQRAAQGNNAKPAASKRTKPAAKPAAKPARTPQENNAAPANKRKRSRRKNAQA